MHYHYLIIGGGVAGVTAAETIREADADASVAVISQEPHVLYSRVLLPNYIKGKVQREQVLLRTIGDFEKKNIVLFLGKEAVLVRPEKKEVQLKTGEIYSFDKLLIASGGAPRSLNIPGEAKRGVFHLQTIDDADAVRAYLPSAKKAVVVGGGFIGLEFLDILQPYEIPTTVIVRGDQVFGDALDAEGKAVFSRHFEKAGIEVVPNDMPVEFFGGDTVEGMRTSAGRTIQADFVGIGAGLKRNSDFLLGTSEGVTPGGGVKTNEFLETPVPGIFAAGDIAEYFDAASGRYHTHGNWTNAVLQGRIAGKNMLSGSRTPFASIPFYSISNLGLHITFLGDVSGDAAEEMVSRSDGGSRYERFFLYDGALVGAVLVNMFQDKTVLAEAIAKKIPVAAFRAKLGDMAFDVRTLLSS